MKKPFSYLIKAFSCIILIVAMCPIAMTILIQSESIQNYIVDKTTKFLSDKTGTVFKIKDISLSLSGRISVGEIYIEDFSKDTLLHSDRLSLRLKGINPLNGRIRLGEIELESVKINLVKGKDSVLNLKKVFDHLKSSNPKKFEPFINIDRLTLASSSFYYLDSLSINEKQAKKGQIDFSNICVNNINFDILNIDINPTELGLSVREFRLKENCGFSLDYTRIPRISINRNSFFLDRPRIKASGSEIDIKRFDLTYDSISDLKTLSNKLKLNLAINSGTIFRPSTLKYFSKVKTNSSFAISLNGDIKGDISDFNGNFVISSCGNSIDAQLHAHGLPDVKNTYFSLNLNGLKTDRQSIDNFYHATGQRDENRKLSDKALKMISSLGEIVLTGKFEGNPHNFNADARLYTSCGDIHLNGFLHPLDSAIQMSGNFEINRFDLGRMLSSPKLGVIDIQTNTKGLYTFKNNFSADGEFRINEFEYSGYKFHDVIANGELENKTFSGKIVSSVDSNLLFTSYGKYDFSRDSIPLYNFAMNLQNADLAAIGLNKKDSTAKLSAQFSANFTGQNIDNINGRLDIDSLSYINSTDTVYSGPIDIEAVNTEIEKNITLESKFADITLSGKNSYKNLIPYFTQLTKTYIPSAKNDNEQIVEKIYDDGFYSLNLIVKESNKIASIFFPGFEIAKGTYVNFYFNPKKNIFSLKAFSDFITKGNLFLDNLKIESHNNKDSLFLALGTSSIDIGKFRISEAGVKTFLHNNSIYCNTFFNDTTNWADIKLKADIIKTSDTSNLIDMRLLPSAFKIDTSLWEIKNKNIIVRSGKVKVDSLKFLSGNQNVLFDGIIGGSRDDTIKMNIDNLDLSPLTIFIKSAGYKISTIANGKVEFVSATKEKILKGKINLSDILFTGEELGSCTVESTYDKIKNRLLLQLQTDEGERPIKGFYALSERVLDLDINMRNLRLALLSPIVGSTLKEMEGTASTKMNFKLYNGKIPLMNGTAYVDTISTKVAYTNVKYGFKGPIKIKDNHITGENLIVHDAEGNTAVLTGSFYSYNFRTLNYDITCNTDRILGLNTTKKDNDIYFGKVYCSGEVKIQGTERNTHIIADATTSQGSVFNMPFSSVSQVNQDKFIIFYDSINHPKPTEKQIVKRKFFNKLTRAKYSNEFEADLTIHVTPDIQANIEYTNLEISNIIQGTGSGRIDMKINPTKEIFTLHGGFNISKGGKYRLIFYLADKTFQLKEGGTINWNGDPANPIVNFTGVYQVHTSIEPLAGTSTSTRNSSVAIDCGIHLTESLFSPKISFDITAPNADAETQNVLRNALNTQEAMSTQFFSLFLTNSFTAENNSSMGNIGTSLVSTTGFEFISNRISSILSTKNFSWRPTYKPKTQQSSDEFGVETKFNLLQNKIVLNLEGRYYVNPTYSNRSNPFSGGGDISIRLNSAGNLNLKAFTRVIDRFDETQGLQESGVGISFTQDFNSWEDLKQRLEKYAETHRQNKIQRKEIRNAKKNKNSQKQSKT